MADLTKIRNLKADQLNEIAVGEIVLNVDAMTYVTKNSEGNVVPYLIRPYKVYTALLTQKDIGAPVATVLENTLGGTVVWARSDVGEYVGTLSGAFTANKTVSPQHLQVFYSDASEQVSLAEIGRVTDDTINLITRNVITYAEELPVLTDLGRLADTLLNAYLIEIRVYD